MAKPIPIVEYGKQISMLFSAQNWFPNFCFFYLEYCFQRAIPEKLIKVADAHDERKRDEDKPNAGDCWLEHADRHECQRQDKQNIWPNDLYQPAVVFLRVVFIAQKLHQESENRRGGSVDHRFRDVKVAQVIFVRTPRIFDDIFPIENEVVDEWKTHVRDEVSDRE